eukprot:m.126595 g.126595  ORF g.126595 m.126595 type:complete len:167 (-) comp13837_c0_seq2:103-603(-)
MRHYIAVSKSQHEQNFKEQLTLLFLDLVTFIFESVCITHYALCMAGIIDVLVLLLLQPQGHVQVLLNMMLFGMNPQKALDAPRFCIGPGHEGVSSTIVLESSLPEMTVLELQRMGHKVEVRSGYDRSIFGRGQIIKREQKATTTGDSAMVYIAGSDPRGDGCALGF